MVFHEKKATEKKLACAVKTCVLHMILCGEMQEPEHHVLLIFYSVIHYK